MAKVLLADDELALRFLITETLAEEGYEVTETEDGAEAVRRLETDAYDVVILDYMMPEKTGVEVCRWLRSAEGNANREKPVILLTAKAQQKDKEEALDAGASEYMMKPFSPLQLLELVDRLAGKRR